jgi:hypothetical protein
LTAVNAAGLDKRNMARAPSNWFAIRTLATQCGRYLRNSAMKPVASKQRLADADSWPQALRY